MIRQVLFSMLMVFVSSMKAADVITYSESPKDRDSLSIHEGIVCTDAKIINYYRNGDKVATIRLSDPVKVAQADKDEPWGFFQFPSIGKKNDGNLLVSWQMAADSHKTYGIKPGMFPMVSENGGLTWKPYEKVCNIIIKDDNLCLKDNSILEINIPRSIDINKYEKFPLPIDKKGKYCYYRMDSLPNELQGIYLIHKKENDFQQLIHARLRDFHLLRYSIDNLMPIVWWGNMKQLADQSLLAGMYPSIYEDSLGKVMPGGISFYRSEDEGNSWLIRGRIPFLPDGIANLRGENCYTEPSFEILADSTLICVMRSGSHSPLYRSFSSDLGVTWTSPQPFTPNGVKPRLMLLRNGVLVLASGRPGVQLRFSFDGKGVCWSDPIDMIPFMNIDRSYNLNVSCGYTSIIDADDNSLYLVYSNFTTKDSMERVRKSIWCSKITITPCKL